MTYDQDQRLIIALERVGTGLLRIAQVMENNQARQVTEEMERGDGLRCMVCTHKATVHTDTGCTVSYSATSRCGCQRTYSAIVGNV